MNSRFFKPPKVTIPFVCASESMGRRSRNRARNRIRELGTAFSGNELASESETLCDQCYVAVTGTVERCERPLRLRRAEHDCCAVDAWVPITCDLHTMFA